MTDIIEETTVEDFLKILKEHRNSCEKDGKYIEAEVARNRIEELRLHERNRRLQTLRSQQIAEKLGLEEANLLEFEQFNAHWDARRTELEAQAAKQLIFINEQHSLEMDELQRQSNEVLRSFNSQSPSTKSLCQNSKDAQQPPLHKGDEKKLLRFVPSKELLNLRHVQGCLGKQKEYHQAARVQARCNFLERYERKRFLQKFERSMDIHRLKVKRKQKTEQEVLGKKLGTSKDEFHKKREGELEKLIKRYENLKQEMEKQQRSERLRLEKYNFNV